jgi:MYXO-CTERM domain-containing protein
MERARPNPLARAPWLLRLLAVALAFASVLLAPRAALAAGTVTVQNTSPEEVNGRWKLMMTIKLPAPPPIAHVPMIFSFDHKVEYERQLNDKSPDKPVLVKKNLTGQTPINEGMDVGFSDASGKTFPLTKFDFVIRRDHGFEAGEYTLTIKRESDGAAIGSPIHLRLQGDNEVVDRRAMVFGTGKEKDTKKVQADERNTGKKGDEAKKDEAKDEKKDEAVEPAAPEAPAAEAPAPPAVPPKQGGCGCRVAGEPAGGAGLAVALVAIGLAALRRRRAA